MLAFPWTRPDISRYRGSVKKFMPDVIYARAPSMMKRRPLSNRASAWSEAFPMADPPNLPDCNPVLFVGAKGELGWFWIPVPGERVFSQ